MSKARKCPSPGCGRAIKGHPNKRFCNSRCKDRYHNTHNPRGYGLALGPAYSLVDDEDRSWDAHKAWGSGGE